MTGKCAICGKEVSYSKLTEGALIRDQILKHIKSHTKNFGDKARICDSCLNDFRSDYILESLTVGKREISKLEKHVAKSIEENQIVSEDISEEYEKGLTFGEKLSDKIAEFGGSWPFIIAFMIFVFGWIGINTYILLTRPFDVYPFILLNLILSCLAAVQAPIIMMSQNRQEERDRLQSKHDYQVNLKAELEIQHLNEKLDLLMKKQWERLMHIQQLQLDMMQEMRKK